MRLICTFTSGSKEENGYLFSYYLTQMGVPHTCEEVVVSGVKELQIWIHEEDDWERAEKFYRDYKADPHNPLFQPKVRPPPPPPASKPRSFRRALSPSPYRPLTLLLLGACIILFFVAAFEVRPPASTLPHLIQAPQLTPVEKGLLFDYPTYFKLRDELTQDPAHNARLLAQMEKSPPWVGIYDVIISRGKQPQGPLFEKIREGQVWRLFTPALLHFNFLHIFFNLLWFILLGNQIESRLGFWRYGLFIVLTGVVSNCAQYLMSGPFFMGLSGIIMAMAGFIWARQQVAPWEGYLLNRATLLFLGAFVGGLALLQLVLFFFQFFGSQSLSIGIANTAHLAGGICGYLLGRTRLFALKV